MPSQFFGLNIAYTGLLANNAALNTTANNIANVQTEGYSRQQVVQRAASALQTFQTYGCAGAGVETLAIERIRDEFYDTKYRNNNSQVGHYDIKQYYMQQIETYFDDNGTNAGFNSIFNSFMVNGIQELMKNPSGDSEKAQFVGTAESLSEYFNGLAGNLENLQKDVNLELKMKVDEINSLAGEIATLNKQINTIEMKDIKANELRDRRDLLVDQLSKIVDLQVSETPITDANNPDRETGGTRYIVTIASGQLLVDGTEFRGLECVARTDYEKVHQSDIDGLYNVYWEDGQEFNLYNAAMGGQLSGLVQMRDGNNGENFNGEVISVGETDDGTQDTVTVQVTQHYLQDLNKSNLSDQGGIINLGNQEFYYDSWEYKCSFDEDGNATHTYTFTLSDGEKNPNRLTNDRIGKTAKTGAAVKYQGVPYYMNQMNEFLRTFAQKFNDILTSGYDTENREGCMMFAADTSTGDEQFDFPDDTRYDWAVQKGEDITIDVTDDSYYRMTAKNFSILTAMAEDPSLLATKYEKSDGAEQIDLLESLMDMVNDKDIMSFRGSNATEFLQNILSDIAVNAQSANIFQTSFTDIAGVIENQRLSISGVDEDEEAINLVKYQNGYSLASKMIQTLTEVYDRLILQTGV